jgi:hypothetical protein
VSSEVRELVEGDGDAMGGLEAFGWSGVTGVDSIVVVLIVVVVVVGETPFTRWR